MIDNSSLAAMFYTSVIIPLPIPHFKFFFLQITTVKGFIQMILIQRYYFESRASPEKKASLLRQFDYYIIIEIPDRFINGIVYYT